eukprot:UC1_evm4s1810
MMVFQLFHVTVAVFTIIALATAATTYAAAGDMATDPSCSSTIDSKDPVRGPVRAGDDIRCIDMPPGHKNDTLEVCIAACCAEPGGACKSFSFNAPWTLNVSYMGCVTGQNCCCLKSGVPPLEPNKWAMNITSGVVVPPPPPLCTPDGACCSLNGQLSSKANGKDNRHTEKKQQEKEEKEEEEEEEEEQHCVCDPGWRGRDCGELALLPAESLAGAYQHPVNLSDCAVSCGPSSWGGLPLYRPEDGLYHLFASQFVQNCTLAGWNPGSTVVRAVSKDPAGPYTYAETVFPTFHHNPTVRRLTPAQSGTGREMFIMLMIGDNVSPPTGSGAACNSDNLDPHHLEGYIKMAWSDSLLGPWNTSGHTMITPGSVNDWDAMVTNPAPLILSNGSAYIFYRGTRWPANGYERIGVTKATSWRGPYGRTPFGNHQPLWDPNDQSAFVEDPFVWEDARGFHMLSHGHWDENGYYAYAKQPTGPWHFRHEPTYTNVVTMVNGSNLTLVQRERPQIFFNRTTGKPAMLFTGVAPPGAKFYGYTYTYMQRIQQPAAVDDR